MELYNRLNLPLQNTLGHLTPGLQDLDLYYSATRYPDTLASMLPGGLPSQQNATDALSTARDVVTLVEGHLYPPNPQP